MKLIKPERELRENEAAGVVLWLNQIRTGRDKGVIYMKLNQNGKSDKGRYITIKLNQNGKLRAPYIIIFNKGGYKTFLITFYNVEQERDHSRKR